MESPADEKESYLSGLSSPSIRRSRLDARCLGVYATNKRIFLVEAPFWMQVMYLPSLFIAVVLLVSVLFFSLSYAFSAVSPPTIALILEWVGLAFLFEGILSGWYKNFSPLSIKDLEARKLFEIGREQVSSIEIRDRGIWRPSKVDIFSKAGEKRTIDFAENGSFEHAKRMFQTFAPQLCVDL